MSLNSRFPKRRYRRFLRSALLALVLLPGALAQVADDSVVGIAAESPDFSTLLSALEIAGLTQELRGEGPFTLFAPTNSAFAALSESELDALLTDRDALRSVLSYHVVLGRYTTSDITDEVNAFNTLQGAELPITQQGVGNATVTAVNLEAANGVVFAIDTVLTPPEAVSTPAPSDEAALYSSTAQTSLRYPLAEVENSGVSGSVLVAAYGGVGEGAVVTVSLSGTPAGGSYPAALIAGSCDAVGTPLAASTLAELNEVSGDLGFSTTVVGLSFDEITGGEHALVVFSAADDDTVLACGEVGEAQ